MCFRTIVGLVVLAAAARSQTPAAAESAHHYQRGAELLGKLDLAGALTELEAAHHLNPANSQTECLLARAYLQVGSAAAATESFGRCAPGRPRDHEAHYYFGIALGQTGHLPEAIREFRNATAVLPSFGPAHHSLGIAYRRSNQDALALGEFRDAAKLMPDNPIAWCDLGLAENATGNTSSAITAFREALRWKPDYERAQYALGTALRKTGQAEASRTEMQYVAKAHQQRAERAAATKLLQDAAALNSQKSYGDVEALYKKAIEAAPDFAEPHMALGIFYARHASPAKAVEELKEAVVWDPDSPDAHYNYALALAAAVHVDDAERELREAISLDQKHMEARLLLGNLLIQKEAYPEAIAVYQEVIRETPDSAEAWNNLGLACLGARHFVDARNALLKATRLKPSYAAAHYNLSLVLRELKDAAGAEQELAVAEKLNSASRE